MIAAEDVRRSVGDLKNLPPRFDEETGGSTNKRQTYVLLRKLREPSAMVDM
jgi:hypothetical protein